MSNRVRRTAFKPQHHFLDRDEAILAFNDRVLCLARRTDFPLLERLRFLCIVSSNLDEFFEVRMASHLTAFQGKDAGLGFTAQTYESVSEHAHALVALQYRVFNELLSPALAEQGIRVLSHGERNAEQRKWVQRYFNDQVRPLLVPIVLDPSHPFPRTANKSLNFIVAVNGRAEGHEPPTVAVIRVPRVLPRLIALPSQLGGNSHTFVSLSSVIRAHLSDMFPDRRVERFSQFRITRNSDLAVDEDDVEDLRLALREGLSTRHFGEPVRVEVSSGCDGALSDRLLKEYDLTERALYQVSGPVNLVRFMQLADLIERPDLKFAAYTPAWPRAFHRGATRSRDPSKPAMFERLQQGDVMLHQPFESFDAVLQFLREAVDDPSVVAIKQTIYRTGSDPEMLKLHRLAVQRGKEVLTVVELKARFDEEANINWAEQLEQIGAQVVYGVVGLKTHGKMLLVTRREGNKLVRYGHLSTGNYNPKTARLYTDISYFTADKQLTQDMEAVFRQVASRSSTEKLSRLWVAPISLHARLTAQLANMRRQAAKGTACRVVAKMNALTDTALMQALIEAGQAGVQIDLIVRGACMLPAGVPGFTDNVRVRSVVGRLLEHSRVFYFLTGQEQQVWLSSADWMTRNMQRRVEIAWPVRDATLQQRILDECLAPYLLDEANAWEMDETGHYRAPWVNDRPAPATLGESGLALQPRTKPPLASAHEQLMAMHGGSSSVQALGPKPKSPKEAREEARASTEAKLKPRIKRNPTVRTQPSKSGPPKLQPADISAPRTDGSPPVVVSADTLKP